jgi:hypothetical protein
MHIHIYAYICIFIHVHMYAYIYVYIYLCIYLQIQIHMYIQVPLNKLPLNLDYTVYELSGGNPFWVKEVRMHLYMYILVTNIDLCLYIIIEIQVILTPYISIYIY